MRLRKKILSFWTSLAILGVFVSIFAIYYKTPARADQSNIKYCINNSSTILNYYTIDTGVVPGCAISNYENYTLTTSPNSNYTQSSYLLRFCISDSLKAYYTLSLDSSNKCVSSFVMQPVDFVFDPNSGYTQYDPSQAITVIGNVCTTSTNSAGTYDASGNCVPTSCTTSAGTAGNYDTYGNCVSISGQSCTTSSGQSGTTDTSGSCVLSIDTNNDSSSYSVNVDPSLASGAFENLDSSDYPYCVYITHNISYGSKDSTSKGDVSALQSYLTDRGYLETGATGFFGQATLLGVKRFEYRNQIEVTGAVTDEMRSVLQELTCVKYPKVTYVDKPITPSSAKNIYYNVNLNYAPQAINGNENNTIIPVTSNNSTVVTKSKTKTVIPTTKASSSTKIPTTSNKTTSYTSITPSSNSASSAVSDSNSSTLNNNKLSSLGGIMSLSQKNNLFFSFTTNSTKPSICISNKGGSCYINSNYSPLKEGMTSNLYEALNLANSWTFTLYNNTNWGSVGNKVQIFLKDSSESNVISIYTIVLNN